MRRAVGRILDRPSTRRLSPPAQDEVVVERSGHTQSQRTLVREGLSQAPASAANRQYSRCSEGEQCPCARLRYRGRKRSVRAVGECIGVEGQIAVGKRRPSIVITRAAVRRHLERDIERIEVRGVFHRPGILRVRKGGCIDRGAASQLGGGARTAALVVEQVTRVHADYCIILELQIIRRKRKIRNKTSAW